MTIRVENRLETTCVTLTVKHLTRRAFFNLMEERSALPGGLHLAVDPSVAGNPRTVRHYYFSQEDRIRIGLFLLSGVPLADLNLSFGKGQARLGGVVRSAEGPGRSMTTTQVG